MLEESYGTGGRAASIAIELFEDSVQGLLNSVHAQGKFVVFDFPLGVRASLFAFGLAGIGLCWRGLVGACCVFVSLMWKGIRGPHICCCGFGVGAAMLVDLLGLLLGCLDSLLLRLLLLLLLLLLSWLRA